MYCSTGQNLSAGNDNAEILLGFSLGIKTCIWTCIPKS